MLRYIKIPPPWATADAHARSAHTTPPLSSDTPFARAIPDTVGYRAGHTPPVPPASTGETSRPPLSDIFLPEACPTGQSLSSPVASVCPHRATWLPPPEAIPAIAPLHARTSAMRHRPRLCVR